MNVSFSFTPAVGFTGTYTVIVYDKANTAVALGQAQFTGPFGSSISGTISGVATADRYVLKIFTNICADPVAAFEVVPNQYSATRTTSFTKECPTGQSGSNVPFTKTYTASTQQGANDMRDNDSTFNAQGQANANATGTCSANIISVPVSYQNYNTFVNPDEYPDHMDQPQPPYNNSYYSYLYKNLSTGHYVFSNYFVAFISNGGIEYAADNSINGGQPAPIMKILDPQYWPSTQITISGSGFEGRPISGYIGTDGYIYMTSSQGHAIHAYDPSNPAKYLMRLSNTTYAAEFANQGIFVQ